MIGTGLADRVKETTTITGTGTITLAGAVSGYRSFLNAFADGAPVCYVIVGGADWEVGAGIITSPDQLSRETVFFSSNGNAKVSWAAGTKEVFASRIEASTNAQIAIAGESIAARDAMYLELYGGARTVGRAYKTNAANNSTSTQAVFIGFATGAAAVGKPVLGKRYGVMGGFSALTAGKPMYLSTTSGGITAICPANARIVGTAVSTTEVFILDGSPLPVADDNTGGNLGIIGHGMYGSGVSGTTNSISKGSSFDYLDLLSGIGNASSRGTTSPATASYGTGGSSGTGFFAGGVIGTTSLTLESAISSFTRYVASGNATDVGDLTLARAGLAGVSGAARSFFGGGLAGTGVSNVIDVLTFASFTTATSDAGDLTLARKGIAAASGTAKGFFAGGDNLGYQSLIDMVDLSTGTQNATDRGDLMSRRTGAAGLSGNEPTIGGGFNNQYLAVLEQIDSNTYSTVALNRGELTVARAFLAAAGVSAMGVFAGGSNGIESTIIENVDPTLGNINVSHRGELSYARSGCSGL